MTDRAFPFVPRSARQLERGDLIAVPCEPSGWACLQVIDVKRAGWGSVKNFVVGALPWFSEELPTPRSVRRKKAAIGGMTRIEIFTHGGCQVVGNAKVNKYGFTSNFDPNLSIGTVHHVWGWKAAIQNARDIAANAR